MKCMIIHTIRDYLLVMFFSFMFDYIKFRLALAISLQGNFHTRCGESVDADADFQVCATS